MTAGASLLLHCLGAGFVTLAVVAAAGVVTARAHFATALCVAATSVFAALALMCFDAGAVALAVVLVGVGIVPVLMLGGVLLSTRAIRSGGRGGAPRLTVVAATAAAVVLLWATQDAAVMRTPLQAPIGLGAWLVFFVFVAGITCTGVLGYGERSALTRRSGGDA